MYPGYQKSSLWRLIFLIALALPNHASLAPLVLQTPDQITPLKSSQGYLLIRLDINGVAPSFKFVSLSGKSDAEVSKLQARKKIKQHRKYSVSLKGLENGYYLLPLPKGLYQIVEVNAPYFNLPYRFNTDYSKLWRFKIAKQAINYAGTLKIAKDRVANYVEIRLHNRLATDESDMHNELTALLEKLPMVSGTGYRDDFYQDFYAH